jgi:Cu/Ag efflux pump CusA
VELVMRLPETWRTWPETMGDLLIETPDNRRIPLSLVVDIQEVNGPNVINRENGQRRIVIGANTGERDLESLVTRWQQAVAAKVTLPEGYTLRFEGEYLARQEASKRILILFAIVTGVIIVLLAGYFRSISLAMQVMLNLPLALAGALAFTWWRIDNISIATLVGFIAVGGVAARNGIMMISHYLHLMRHEGESFGVQLITRGTQERLVPVLMTALAAGIALIPLVLSPGEPGKEILHPVAVAIVGGLVSSTLLDLVVTPAVFFLIGRRAAEKALRLDAPAAR